MTFDELKKEADIQGYKLVKNRIILSYVLVPSAELKEQKTGTMYSIKNGLSNVQTVNFAVYLQTIKQV